MSKIKVLLLFGGESSEHDVSISSAQNVYQAINKEKYHLSLCYIDPSGLWWYLSEFSDYKNTDTCQQLLPVLGKGQFVKKGDNQIVKPDVVLPILHGRNGEDGSVQGVAQLMHIPIVGCDVTASGIAMNKLSCKAVLQANNIDVIPYVSHYVYQDTPNFDELSAHLGDTLFVKPARAGSSMGVSKVRDQAELVLAIDEAHKHDSIALIERAISGHELETAVLGTPPHHKVSGVGEIIPGEDFYTYKDKYASNSKARVSISADISAHNKEKVRDIAGRVYELMDCRGLSRIDFMLSSNDVLYVMEINTLPGFTDISMYPRLWQNEGVSYSKLIDELINDAIQNGTINSR